MAKQNIDGIFGVPYSRLSAKQKLNRKSVALVEEYARVVVVVDERGIPLTSWINDNYNLDVIVVLGNVDDFGVTILLEIGISRTRPYRTARGRMKKWMHKRHKFFSLNKKQLCRLWPFLEDSMLVLVNKRVSLWKKDTYIIERPGYHTVNSRGLRSRRSGIGENEKTYTKEFVFQYRMKIIY